jgi:hypothetical protein
MKWSRTRPSLTLSLNSSWRRTSRLTVSSLGLTISACFTPFRSMFIVATPSGKHLTNFSASAFIIGDKISIVGNNR